MFVVCTAALANKKEREQSEKKGKKNEKEHFETGVFIRCTVNRPHYAVVIAGKIVEMERDHAESIVTGFTGNYLKNMLHRGIRTHSRGRFIDQKRVIWTMRSANVMAAVHAIRRYRELRVV